MIVWKTFGFVLVNILIMHGVFGEIREVLEFGDATNVRVELILQCINGTGENLYMVDLQHFS